MVRLLIILSLLLPHTGVAFSEDDQDDLGEQLIYDRCLVHWGVGAECVDSVLTYALEAGVEGLDCYSTIAQLADGLGESDSGADDFVASNGGGTGTGSGCIYNPD